MGLGIENEFLQIDFLAIIAEQQVEVFQRFAQEETLHHVLGSSILDVLHIADGRVTVCDFRVLLESIEHGPPHVLIRVIASQRIEIV